MYGVCYVIMYWNFYHVDQNLNSPHENTEPFNRDMKYSMFNFICYTVVLWYKPCLKKEKKRERERERALDFAT